MGIIINDFEILLDPPQPTSGRQQNQNGAQQSSPPALSPQDIERIMRHFEERRHRLRAD